MMNNIIVFLEGQLQQAKSPDEWATICGILDGLNYRTGRQIGYEFPADRFGANAGA